MSVKDDVIPATGPASLTPHPTDVYVGRQLRARRVILGFSQEKLASAVNITFQQVQKYERGANRISASRLYEFSKVLGVPIGYFFEGLDAEEPVGGLSEEAEGYIASPPPSVAQTRDAADLVRLFNTLPTSAVRRQVLGLVRSVAASVATSSGEGSTSAAE